MSEPIPVLPYRMNEYVRRQIYVVLAILLIISGAISSFASASSAFKNVANLPKYGHVWVYFIVISFFWIARMACLVAAGIAFLIRSKHVTTLLWAYFLVTLCSELADPAINVLMQVGLALADVSQTALYCMRDLPRAIVAVVLLMLLRTKEVRKIIRAVTEAPDQSV